MVGLRGGPSLGELIEFMKKLAQSLFTGRLTIDFHTGSVGKVQVTRTIKTTDFDNFAIKACF